MASVSFYFYLTNSNQGLQKQASHPLVGSWQTRQAGFLPANLKNSAAFSSE
jgi:hypothetical protein